MSKIIVEYNPTNMGKQPSNYAHFNVRESFPEFEWNPADGSIIHKPFSKEYAKPDIRFYDLIAIPGISKLYSYSSSDLYQLAVKKATAYSWEELEPQILKALGEELLAIPVATPHDFQNVTDDDIPF